MKKQNEELKAKLARVEADAAGLLKAREEQAKWEKEQKAHAESVSRLTAKFLGFTEDASQTTAGAAPPAQAQTATKAAPAATTSHDCMHSRTSRAQYLIILRNGSPWRAIYILRRAILCGSSALLGCILLPLSSS